jgi:predicted DNA-binding transcriptional regulator AlpA
MTTTRSTQPEGPGEPRRLLSVREAAARLGLSKSTLDKARVRGGTDAPPFIRLFGRVLYDPAMLDAWVASRVRRSTSDRGGTPAAA